jgi:uncharacterized membrane protein
MNSLSEIVQFLAVFCCSLFAGAALYITFVEHPAKMECGTEVAATEFPPSYRRAAVMQASLAMLGFLCSIIAWLMDANVSWLVGGMVLLSVVLYTLIVILPTNQELLDPSLDKRSDKTTRLLSRWGRLHTVRTALSVLALMIFLYRMAIK